MFKLIMSVLTLILIPTTFVFAQGKIAWDKSVIAGKSSDITEFIKGHQSIYNGLTTEALTYGSTGIRSINLVSLKEVMGIYCQPDTMD